MLSHPEFHFVFHWRILQVLFSLYSLRNMKVNFCHCRRLMTYKQVEKLGDKSFHWRIYVLYRPICNLEDCSVQNYDRNVLLCVLYTKCIRWTHSDVNVCPSLCLSVSLPYSSREFFLNLVMHDFFYPRLVIVFPTWHEVQIESYQISGRLKVYNFYMKHFPVCFIFNGKVKVKVELSLCFNWVPSH